MLHIKGWIFKESWFRLYACATFYTRFSLVCIHIWILRLRWITAEDKIAVLCLHLGKPIGALFAKNYKLVHVMRNLTFMCTKIIMPIYRESIFRLHFRLLLANFYVITEKTETWFTCSSFGGMTLTESKWLLFQKVLEPEWIKDWGNYCAIQPGFVKNEA